MLISIIFSWLFVLIGIICGQQPHDAIATKEDLQNTGGML